MAATVATTSAAMAATAAAATKIGNPQTKSARDLLLPIFCTTWLHLSSKGCKFVLLNKTQYTMSLFDAILGNATKVNIKELTQEFGEILIPDEVVESAFAVIRDKWIFTNKRLILTNIQGLSGKKSEYMTIPYRSIDRFSIETSGSLDDDCEMKIWIKGMEEPLVQNFNNETDIKSLQRALASHIL